MLISRAALGVFVIHKNSVIDARFVYQSSNDFATLPAGSMILHVLLLILEIYFVSLAASVVFTTIADFISRRLSRLDDALGHPLQIK